MEWTLMNLCGTSIVQINILIIFGSMVFYKHHTKKAIHPILVYFGFIWTGMLYIKLAMANKENYSLYSFKDRLILSLNDLFSSFLFPLIMFVIIFYLIGIIEKKINGDEQ